MTRTDLSFCSISGKLFATPLLESGAQKNRRTKSLTNDTPLFPHTTMSKMSLFDFQPRKQKFKPVEENGDVGANTWKLLASLGLHPSRHSNLGASCSQPSIRGPKPQRTAEAQT